MKQKLSSQKTARHNSQGLDQTPSSGPNGVALIPPTYGINSINREMEVAPEADQEQTIGMPIQMKKAAVTAAGSDNRLRPPNRTGLPDVLKTGVESLSGLALDDVRVHYNSPKPAQLQALAYTKGTDIYVGSGQERHLPHEAWHVVQQKQGRVKTNMQPKGIGINDDVVLEQEADVMGRRAQASPTSPVRLGAEAPSSSSLADSQPVQRIIRIGANFPYTIYNTRHGKATTDLVLRLAAKLKTDGLKLKTGWKGTLRGWAADTNHLNTKTFADEDALLAALKIDFPPTSASKKRKKDIETQDTNIIGLLSGIDESKRKRAKTISSNSKKAWDKFVLDLGKNTQSTETLKELKTLKPGDMSTTSDVSKTNLPAFFFSALGTGGEKMELERMDFNFNSTEVLTHGFESPGKRDISPKGTYDTKKGKKKNFQPFNFNTVKIGNNIGTYAKHQTAPPKDLQNQHVTTLNTLEKFRLPEQAFGTSLKRDFFTQNLFDTQEAFGQNHLHSNVEFLGATSGSGLTSTQYSNMHEQQSLSNLHILTNAFTKFPNQPIGFDTKDGKARTTPKEITENLDNWLNEPKKEEKKKKKQKFRRSLKRAIISTENIPGIDSDDEVSDEDL